MKPDTLKLDTSLLQHGRPATVMLIGGQLSITQLSQLVTALVAAGVRSRVTPQQAFNADAPRDRAYLLTSGDTESDYGLVWGEGYPHSTPVAPRTRDEPLPLSFLINTDQPAATGLACIRALCQELRLPYYVVVSTPRTASRPGDPSIAIGWMEGWYPGASEIYQAAVDIETGEVLLPHRRDPVGYDLGVAVSCKVPPFRTVLRLNYVRLGSRVLDVALAEFPVEVTDVTTVFVYCPDQIHYCPEYGPAPTYALWACNHSGHVTSPQGYADAITAVFTDQEGPSYSAPYHYRCAFIDEAVATGPAYKQVRAAKYPEASDDMELEDILCQGPTHYHTHPSIARMTMKVPDVGY